MTFWIIGTAHLKPRTAVYVARCICGGSPLRPRSWESGCPFHQRPVRVFPR